MPGRREPDAAPDPLHQSGAGLGFEPGEVVADCRLRVVQFLGGRGERSVPGQGVEDPVGAENSSEPVTWPFVPQSDQLPLIT